MEENIKYENFRAKSSIELQNLDCNCNNCIFMRRDFDAFQKWSDFRKEQQFMEFKRKKEFAIEVANNHPEPKARQSLLRKANKLQFQFDKSDLLNYGHCEKFNKSVVFIPDTCQIETQHCFKNRK